MDYRKLFCSIVFGAIFVIGLGSLKPVEAEEKYPIKPINLIVPWAPGGDTDLTARIWAEYMGKLLGQPIVVLNKAGAAGITGTLFVAQANPDGYTLIQGSCGGNLVGPQLTKSGYDLDSFMAVCQIGAYPAGLAVNADSPWKTLEEFIQEAKNNPGKLSYASPGASTWNSLVMKYWEMQAGIKVKDIHFQGSSPATTALMGKHCDFTFIPPQNFVPQVKGKTLRLLAVGELWEEYPEIPTFKKLGYKGNYSSWSGTLAPKGTPINVIKKLSDTTMKLAKDPRYIDALNKVNSKPSFKGYEEWQEDLQKQYKDLGMVIVQMGLRK